MKRSIFNSALLLVALVLTALQGSWLRAAPTPRLELSVLDLDSEPLPCRVHLSDQQGNAQKADGLPFWHDHFVCDGRATVSLAAGTYDYAIERGPEYRRQTGQVEIADGERHALQVKLERIANLRAADWYCGDLHVHRPLTDIEQLMQAEDLDFAPVITWWNNRNDWKEKAIPERVVHRFAPHRLYSVMAGEDEREGGALLYFGLRSPLVVATDDREFPSPMHFVEEARRRNREAWIDIEKPFWWDVPIWLASGRMNSIGVANNHMCRSEMYTSEAWGRPRDVDRFPAPLGNGYWTQEIYYHMLNAGLRLPPSAGSASGVLPNPVGYNRVYVQLDEPFTYDAWFRALSRGHCFVTNGPLLVVTVDEQGPGGIIKLNSAAERVLHVTIQLTSQDPIRQLELVANGQVSRRIACSNALQQRHSIEFAVDGTGWFLVRAIADVKNTFRFGMTAPWFVEVRDGDHRISRASVEFFLDWVNERTKRVRANIADESKRQAVLAWHEMARRFWNDRLNTANAD